MVGTRLSPFAAEFVPSGWSFDNGQAPLEIQGDGVASDELKDGNQSKAESRELGIGVSGAELTMCEHEGTASAEGHHRRLVPSLPRTTSPQRATSSHGEGCSASSARQVFVPSWCRDPPADHGDGSVGLPVVQAIQRLRAQDKSHQQCEEKQKPSRNTHIEVRHYVHQVLSEKLDDLVKSMLGELVRFQERAKAVDPQKYQKLKRICIGMREAQRALERNKAKCVICAPNLEASTAEGGLDETVEQLIELAREHEIPVIFALSRNRIGKAVGRSIRLSIVAVLSADGVHQIFKEVLALTQELRKQWLLRHMAQVSCEDAEEVTKRAAERKKRNALKKEVKAREADERRQEEARQRDELRQAKKAERDRLKKERDEKRREDKARQAELEEDEDMKAAFRSLSCEVEEKETNAITTAAEQFSEKDQQRWEAEQRAYDERMRAQDEADAALRAEEEDTDSDIDLPAGFSNALF